MSGFEAVATIVLVLLAMWSVATSVNAIRPLRNVVMLLPSMLWSWFAIGLPIQNIVIQMLLTAGLVWLGALATPIGWIALGALVVSWMATAWVVFEVRGAREVVDRALSAAGIPRTTHTIPRWRSIIAFPMRGRTVRKYPNVEFHRVAGRRLKLDVYTGGSEVDADRADRPVLLYIHGGGWVVGDKREQGLPLIHHFARSGWVCVSVNYRLSPAAGWPDHLCDVKAGLRWIREHIAEYGGDPSYIAVAGGSAGGHIAAMVGLTENDPRYQRGFETVDTYVSMTVPIYGIYDTTNRLGVQNPRFVPMLMEPLVIKAFLDDEPERFASAAPIDQVHSDAPPFVVVQGDKDTMAPVEEARAFVDRLMAVSTSDVVYMEFPGAQHIFDLGYSHQSVQMIEGVLSVLEAHRRAH